MPRSFENKFEMPYTWRQTVLAVWHKYPNQFAPHVVSMDVLDKTYDEETGLLRIERLLGVRQGAPTWVVKLLGGGDDTYVREITMIDPAKNSFEMTSTNLSLSRYLLAKEYITYLPSRAAVPPGSEDGASRAATTFKQRAVITCTGLQGGYLDRAAKKIEDLSQQRYQDNASRGRDGLFSVCKALWGDVRDPTT